ncbi:hypothetical protein GMA12_06865 [Kocuria sediminis]|uniref:Uncharacterized protein n=1 Tax=Kocuria sediminis TaxID=1038857 RepID=A0A6N8GNL9_9MICC|nr:hypothetical protein [Kocuria sediminis]MUN62863.1 hypothetical protein [Kocuria sediminis]
MLPAPAPTQVGAEGHQGCARQDDERSLHGIEGPDQQAEQTGGDQLS